MARPKKNEALDLTVTHVLSVGLIERLTCPAGLPKAFLKDADVTGLKVRVSPTGTKSFVYEAKLKGKAISRTLGGFPLMTIEEAKNKALELAKTIKKDKKDPRELERMEAVAVAAEIAKIAAKVEADRIEAESDRIKAEALLEVARIEAAAKVEADKVESTTAGEVWTVYLAARKKYWGDRHYLDQVSLVKPGGIETKRGTHGRGVTGPGLLHAFMGLPLMELTAPVIEAWADNEAKTRPSAARLAWRCLKAFLGWCAEQPEYAALVSDKNPAKTKKSREALGKPREKKDALLKEQLPAWFDAVLQIQNPVIAAYLQTLLMTGARAGEVLGLRWTDINTKWRGMTIKDKVEGLRVIPYTPYIASLLATLPRRNEFVFSSAMAAGGTLVIPRNPHHAACAVAGIDGLTIHGLRRSFKSLTEWLEVPVGVVAQIQGHKPSATAEKHYTVRPLDMLRVHHEKIEAWILEQAGVTFDAKAAPAALRVVAS
jgi:integrase